MNYTLKGLLYYVGHVLCRTVRKNRNQGVEYCSHRGESTVADNSVGWQEWRWREMSLFEIHFRGSKGRARGQIGFGGREAGKWEKGSILTLMSVTQLHGW